MSKYPPEEIYEIWWHGPYNLENLKAESEEFVATLKLYARYDDHPLYGRDVLTYIGKATKQTVITRLNQHGVDLETIYGQSRLSNLDRYCSSFHAFLDL